MRSKIKVIVTLVGLLPCVTQTARAQDSCTGKLSEPLSKFIQHVWALDTCGKNSYRLHIIEFLLAEDDSTYNLYGCDSNTIISLLGQPHTRLKEDNGEKIFHYYSMLFINDAGNCFHPQGLEGQGIAFRFEASTGRVIRYFPFME